MTTESHPSEPRSNVAKFSGYNPDKYALAEVSNVVRCHESLLPNRPPSLTQDSVGKFLQPLTRELAEVPPRPTVNELPDPVIENMVKKDKAFWVDKPGANAYVLHDAYYQYGMTTEKILPNPQAVFPRSYQYDLDCVKYRQTYACGDPKKPHAKNISNNAQCRDCRKLNSPTSALLQQARETSKGQKRWRDYPDLTAILTPQEIRKYMQNVGRPFRNEACNWYYENYPPVDHECILRKFSK